MIKFWKPAKSTGSEAMLISEGNNRAVYHARLWRSQVLRAARGQAKIKVWMQHYCTENKIWRGHFWRLHLYLGTLARQTSAGSTILWRQCKIKFLRLQMCIWTAQEQVLKVTQMYWKFGKIKYWRQNKSAGTYIRSIYESSTSIQWVKVVMILSWKCYKQNLSKAMCRSNLILVLIINYLKP